MLKLMKYEFRKLRATLVVLLLALVGLELLFLTGMTPLHSMVFPAVQPQVIQGFRQYAHNSPFTPQSPRSEKNPSPSGRFGGVFLRGG